MKSFAALSSALALTAALTAAGADASAQTLGDTSFDLRMGPSIGIVDAAGTQLRISTRFGYNVTRQSTTRVVLEVPVDVGLGAGFTFFGVLPGVRAEIPVSSTVPLYLTPSAGVGVGIATSSGNSAQPALGVRFSVGVRYVFQNRFHVSFDPVNVELYPVGFERAVPGFYNVMFGTGMTF